MNYGYVQRTKRRVHVLKGFDPSGLAQIDHVAPVTSGVTIKSGQIIVLTNGEWVLADSASTYGKTPYTALADSSDTDVHASGLLPALSCAGKFEIETGYYSGIDAEDTADLPLTYGTGATAGSVVLATNPIAYDEDIIGYTSGAVYQDLGRAGGLPVKDNSASDVTVVQFVTNWIPNHVNS